MELSNFLNISKAAVALAACAMLSSASQAQTVVVNAALGSPDNIVSFNNLQDAIGSFRTAASTGGAGVNSGNVLPNIVNVTATTPVLGTANFDALAAGGRPELIVMDEDITVNGVGGKAVFAGTRIPSSTINGAFVWRQNKNLTLNDIAIIPADATPTVLLYTKATQTGGDNTVINLNRCVLTANNGSNQPLTTTGQDDPETTAAGVIALPAGGDALYVVSRVEQGNITANLTDTIIASYGVSGSSDGIIMFMQGTTSDFINCFVNLNEGCVIANAPRFGIQNPYGGSLKINGSAVKPVVIRRTAADAVWNSSDATGATQPTACSVNNARFINITGSAVKEQETNLRGFVSSVTNTRIANCSSPGIALFGNGALPPGGESTGTVTISNVVIHNTGTAATPAAYDNFQAQIASPTYTGGISSNRNVVVTNAILTGATPGLNGIYNSSNGAYTVSNSLASLAGVNALTADYVAVLPGVITQGSGNTSGAVSYTNTTNPFAADFLVPVTSGVNDWSVY